MKGKALDKPMANDLRGPFEPALAPLGRGTASARAAVSAAKPAPLPLRGEITPTVPASGK